MLAVILIVVIASLPYTSGHAAIFHPSMWGFNVTMQSYSYDNRPVAPIQNYAFDQWWFHGHLDHPPNPGDFFELPAGKPATAEIACDKGATSYWESDPGGNIQSGDDVCPGSPPSEYHTTGPDDLKGCSLAITYQSNVSEVQPEDFTVFSVNQTCVWTRFTDFQVPARMPPCPDGGCICAFFWIHSPDSGSEQNYMNGFRCNVTGSTSNVPLATPQVPRRCGADPLNNKPQASPGNCTYGAKQPFYWDQLERNSMFEGIYSPPFYNDLYNFLDGAQEDIFQDSYPNGIPSPSPNATVIPTPNLRGVAPTSTPSAPFIAVSAVAPAPSSSVVPTSSSAASLSASPLSTASGINGSYATSGSNSLPVSTTSSASVSVSTSTVVSTLVVTVTASPGPSSSVGSVLSGLSQASSSSLPPLSAVSAVPSSAPTLSSVFASPAATTIFLNRPSFTGALSSPSVAPAQNGTAVPSKALFELGQQSGSLHLAASATANVVPSSAINSMCKRQFVRRSFRRRSISSEIKSTTVVRSGLRSHRKLQNRSKLWSFF